MALILSEANTRAAMDETLRTIRTKDAEARQE